MKIVEPSAVIFEQELAGLSVCQRIDRCASVCYQRPQKPTEEEAQAFCRSLIERGHLPALEFATIHLAMPFWDSLDYREEKYLHVSAAPSNPAGFVSGSVRAFMELDYESHVCGLYVRNFLVGALWLFFAGSNTPQGHVSFATPEEIPWQHRHVAVRVICSRAISHELVRHRPCSFLQESQRFCKYDKEMTFIQPEWVGRGDFLLDSLFKRNCKSIEMMYRLRRLAELSPQQSRGAMNNDSKTEIIVYANLLEWRHILELRTSMAAEPSMREVMIPLQQALQERYPAVFS